MATIRVTTQTGLISALNSAEAGDTVVLADGNYGDVSIRNDYTSAVTIQAENPLGAVFGKLSLLGATNITLDGLQTTGAMVVKSLSAGITVENCDVDNTFYCRDVDGLRIDNVDVSGGQFGLLLNSVQNFEVTNSHIHEAIEDLMRVTGNSYNGVIENNVLADPIGAKPLHPDILQLFGANGYTPHDLVIRGNLMYDNTVDGQCIAQGIFMSDPNTRGGYKNILIEENMIRTNSVNTIYINGGQENVQVKNNVLMPGLGDGGAMVRIVGKAGLDNSGTTVDGNIMKLLVDETKTSHIGDNYVYGRDADLSKLFSGTDYTQWESYVPVEGSPIDFGSHYGPQALLIEAMGGLEPTTDSTPSSGVGGGGSGMVDTGSGLIVDKVDPILIDKTDPVLVDKTDPVLVDKTDPVLVDKTDPVLVDKTDPVLVEKTDPVLVDKAEPILVDKAGPVLTQAAHLVYSHDDEISLRGWGKSYLADAHTDAMQVDQGTISLTFNADQTTWQRGLISKDAAGLGDSVSAWIKAGTLIVQFEDGENRITMTKENIQTHTDYDLTISFDDAKVKVWLNDGLVGEADMDVNLSGNHEALIVGGYNGKSASGTTDDVQYMFDGTFNDVSFYDKALTPAEVAALDAQHHTDAVVAIAEMPTVHAW